MTSGSVEHNNNLITVQLVLSPTSRGWIIEKFANRLLENLAQWNVQATLSDQPSGSADINHWMMYHDCKGECQTKGTMLITHVDDVEKLGRVKRGLKVADVGICLSRMTVEQLIQQGVSRSQLCFITPAHDGLVTPRRVVIGITTQVRVYSGYRKRENMLVEVANKIRLDNFHFKIFGAGWEEIISHLEVAGATVHYDPGAGDYSRDYKSIVEAVPAFDYYLYMGLDEGSMGTIDALAAGVATIVTPQGFHLDIEGGITYPFQDTAQLCEIFNTIAEQRRRRIDGVKNLTWKEYARRHAVVWRALLENRQDEIDCLLHRDQRSGFEEYSQSRHLAIADKISFYGFPIYRRLRKLAGNILPRSPK